MGRTLFVAASASDCANARAVKGCVIGPAQGSHQFFTVSRSMFAMGLALQIKGLDSFFDGEATDHEAREICASRLSEGMSHAFRFEDEEQA
ncbi:hypothetical protein [Novosphingobium aquimarinum]|uniref:hypothetical protein n=1 Tax=Novosphingobium aquimarinum TaxID=2682494 RepID=UPI0012EB8C65|nr:hypothetical protein [Novosphingobium aquimarinum]